jgi:hypothetical protein
MEEGKTGRQQQEEEAGGQPVDGSFDAVEALYPTALDLRG